MSNVKSSCNRFITLLIVGSLVVLGGAVLCQAGLGIFPYELDFELSFGETEERAINVTNVDKRTRTVTAEVVGIRTTASGDIVWLDEESKDPNGEFFEYGDISSIIEVEPKQLIVKAESTVEFNIRVAAPKEYIGGEPVGRAGAVLFKSTVAVGEETDAPFFQYGYQIAAPVLVVFNEHQQLGAKLVETKVLQHKEDKLQLLVTVENTGNVHFVPDGKVVIRNLENEESVAQLAISTGTALPNSQREYYANWTIPPDASGTYEVTFTVSFSEKSESKLDASDQFEILEGRLVTNP